MKRAAISAIALGLLTGCSQTTYEMSASDQQRLKSHYASICAREGHPHGSQANERCTWYYGHQYNNAVYNQRSVNAAAFVNAANTYNQQQRYYGQSTMVPCQYYKPRVHAAGRAPIYTNC